MARVGEGFYDPRNEHDSCGIGFVANIKGRKSQDIIARGLQVLVNLDHRGAVGADPLVGDGAGCLIQTSLRGVDGLCPKSFNSGAAWIWDCYRHAADGPAPRAPRKKI
jgi:glutamate synthase domain-containing protein 1